MSGYRPIAPGQSLPDVREVSGHECRPSEFRVAIVPDGHELRERFSDMDIYSIEVSWRGKPWNDIDNVSDDRWAVKYRTRCWHIALGWTHEPSPSEREPEYYRWTRFPLAEAKAIALGQAAVELARLEERHGA